jgi:hypothetical protein
MVELSERDINDLVDALVEKVKHGWDMDTRAIVYQAVVDTMLTVEGVVTMAAWRGFIGAEPETPATVAQDEPASGWIMLPFFLISVFTVFAAGYGVYTLLSNIWP